MASFEYKAKTRANANALKSTLDRQEKSCKGTGLFWAATAVISGVLAVLNFRNAGRNQGMRMAVDVTEKELIEPHLDYWEQVENNKDKPKE